MQQYSVLAPLLMVLYQTHDGHLLLLSIENFSHKQTVGHNAAIKLIAEFEM
jgi:hypothetical protein